MNKRFTIHASKGCLVCREELNKNEKKPGEMCPTLYLCLYFILEGLGLGFNLKFSENYSKIIKGPGVAAVHLVFGGRIPEISLRNLSFNFG